MPMSPKLYGFVGVIGSGKNYQQALLVKDGWVGIDFKDELIDMCADLVGYDVRQDYDWFKEHIIGIRRPIGLDMKAGYEENAANRLQASNELIMTGRRLLQRMGTEVMRKRDPDYWVNAWRKKVDAALRDGKNVAVADVRFQNEVEAIKGFEFQSYAPIDAKIIFCDYRSEKYDDKSTHESEKMAQEFKRMGYRDQEEIKMTCLDPSGQTLCRWRVSR